MPETPCETAACSGKVSTVPQPRRPWPWIITFVPESAAPGEKATSVKPWVESPPIYRVKKMLKAALRAYGLRCVRIEAMDPEFSAPVLVPPRRKRKSPSRAA